MHDLQHIVNFSFAIYFEIQVVKELESAWSEFSVDEHVPLHEYMMALAIKMISKTQLGAFFKNDQNVRTFHQHYIKVRCPIHSNFQGCFCIKKIISNNN